MIVEITPRLFQGDVDDAIRATTNGIVGTIVFLGLQLPPDLWNQSRVPVIHIPLRDESQNPVFYETVYDVIKTLSGKVLVACMAGMSRSAMMCFYYMVKQGGDPCLVDVYLRRKIKAFFPEPTLFDQIWQGFTREDLMLPHELRRNTS